jgi:2-methylcitrate dehydratase PrpD
MTSYLDRVAEFAATHPYRDIPAATVQRTKLVIADCLGAIVGGAAEPEMQDLSARLIGPDGGGPASVMGGGRRVEAGKAALLNGAAGTFLEMDEGNQFCRGHPGIHTFPAAFAWAEAHDVSGPDLIAAVTIGYEVGARVGIAAKLRPSMHPHGTWGAICAAVAVGRLAGYDTGRMKTLLNVGSNLALATSKQTMLEGGTVRNIFAGVSGQMGILAEDLVGAGFTGEADGIAKVFGKVISDDFSPGDMVHELGERWEISRNYFKLHSCCRYNHAALDALSQIMARPGTAPRAQDIATIEVDTYSMAVELNDRNPTNTLAGKFSVPFAVATTLINGSSGVGSFTWDAIGNEAIQALAQKVVLREDPSMTAKLPDLRPAAIKITLTDGSTLQAATQTNRGDWADPYSEGELTDKYFSLTARIWDRADAEAVHGEVMNLSEAASVAPLSRLTHQAGRTARAAC